MAYSKETTIDAPPEKVFAYVSDLEKHGEWGTHDNSVKRRDDSPIALGKVYDSVGHQFGTQKEVVTVIDYVPGKRFGYESTGKIGVVRHAFDLAPMGAGTRVIKSMDIVKASLMTTLMKPMIGRKAPPGLEEDLRRWKLKFPVMATLQ